MDQLAKEGAKTIMDKNECFGLHLTSHEITAILKRSLSNEKLFFKEYNCARHISSIIYKLKLNSWRCKYVKDITCPCLEEITIEHILFNCKLLHQNKPEYDDLSLEKVLENDDILRDIANRLFKSDLYKYF